MVQVRTALLASTLAFLAHPALGADVCYVTTRGANPQLLTINPATAAVLSSVPIAGATWLQGGLADDGTFLYAIDGPVDGLSDRLLRINPASGAATVVGNTGFDWSLRACDFERYSGTLYAINDANRMYTVDLATGAAASYQQLFGGGLDTLTAFAISPNNEAFGSDISDTTLYRINMFSEFTIWLGNGSIGAGFSDIAFDSAGALWGIKAGGGIYGIDRQAGQTAFIVGSPDWAGIAFRWDCRTTFYCAGKVNSLGCTPTMSTQGVSSASAGWGYYIRATAVRNNTIGLLLYSTSGRAAVPFVGGTLCLAAPVRRALGINSGGTPPPAANCSGVFDFDMNWFATGGLGGNPSPALWIAGTQVNCQFWGRDQGFAPPNNAMLSNALEYVVCP